MEEFDRQLLQERNTLLRESVELQREGLELSKKQAVESTKRIGDYVDRLLIEGINAVINDLHAATTEVYNDKTVQEALKKLKILTENGELPV